MYYQENLGRKLSIDDEKLFLERLKRGSVAAGDVVNFNQLSDADISFQVITRLLRGVDIIPNSTIKKIYDLLSEEGMDYGHVKNLLRHWGWRIIKVDERGDCSSGWVSHFVIVAFKKAGSSPDENNYRITLKFHTDKDCIISTCPTKIINVSMTKNNENTDEEYVINETNLVEILDNPGNLYSSYKNKLKKSKYSM